MYVIHKKWYCLLITHSSNYLESTSDFMFSYCGDMYEIREYGIKFDDEYNRVEKVPWKCCGYTIMAKIPLNTHMKSLVKKQEDRDYPGHDQITPHAL